MKQYRYKTFPQNRCPHGHQYKLDKWYKTKGDLVRCINGFHCSTNFIDAFSFVLPGWVGKVEVRGKNIIEKDKEIWEEIRVVKWKKWDKKNSVKLAIFSAELVLPIYEKQGVSRAPREAIKAAKNYLKNPTKSAARSAESAASAAASAASACGAAWSAWSAARSAESAAYGAEESTASAARNAASAAVNAAGSSESAASAASAVSAARNAERSAERAVWGFTLEKTQKKIHNYICELKNL